MFVASETIAGTLVNLLTDGAALERARAEFEERTGGGVGGDDWVGPLLDEEVVPPVDLPWPEYVETRRGREWSMPTPHPEAGLGEPLADAD